MDECSDNSDVCPLNSICSNSRGSYECHCKDGYSMTGGLCTGKYNMQYCVWNKGTEYTFNPRHLSITTLKCSFLWITDCLFISVSDINECWSTNPCDVEHPENRDCVNTEGGVACPCKLGYTYNDNNGRCEGKSKQEIKDFANVNKS